MYFQLQEADTQQDVNNAFAECSDWRVEIDGLASSLKLENKDHFCERSHRILCCDQMQFCLIESP